MLYSKLVLSFCSSSIEIEQRHDMVNQASFAVHAKSTVESVLASIQQGACRIQQVASRLPSLAECKVFDKGDFALEHSYLSGNGSEPAYPIKDVIKLALSFARDEVLPKYDSLAWIIQSKRGGLPCCTFDLVLHLTPLETSARSLHTQPHLQQGNSMQSSPSHQQLQACQAALPLAHRVQANAQAPGPDTHPPQVISTVPTSKPAFVTGLHTSAELSLITSAKQAPACKGTTAQRLPAAVAAAADDSGDDDCVMLSQDAPPHRVPGLRVSSATHHAATATVADVKTARASDGAGPSAAAVGALVDGLLMGAKVNQPNAASAEPSSVPTRHDLVPSTAGAKSGSAKSVKTADLAAILAYGAAATATICSDTSRGNDGHQLDKFPKATKSRGSYQVLLRKRASGTLKGKSQIHSTSNKGRKLSHSGARSGANIEDGTLLDHVEKEMPQQQLHLPQRPGDKASPSLTGKEFKFCNACGKAKNISNFGRHPSRNGLHSYCNTCVPIWNKWKGIKSVQQIRTAMKDGSIDTIMAEMDDTRHPKQPQEGTVATLEPAFGGTDASLSGQPVKRCNACCKYKCTKEFPSRVRDYGTRPGSYCKVCDPIVERCRRERGLNAPTVRAAMQDGSIDIILAEMAEETTGKKQKEQSEEPPEKDSVAPAPFKTVPAVRGALVGGSKQCAICKEHKNLQTFKSDGRQCRFFCNSPDIFCTSCRDILRRAYSKNVNIHVDEVRQAYRDGTITELLASDRQPSNPPTPRRGTNSSVAAPAALQGQALEQAAGSEQAVPGPSGHAEDQQQVMAADLVKPEADTNA